MAGIDNEARLKELIAEYLKKTRMMQLATCFKSQPWACTVYYAYDEDWNMYWISLPERRHSHDIAKNPKVAGTMAYSQEPHPKNGVRGLQFEGVARLLSGEDEERASKLYIKQLKREATLLEDIRSGKNPHKFYMAKPTMFVLFDSVSFPEAPRQEYHPQ